MKFRFAFVVVILSTVGVSVVSCWLILSGQKEEPEEHYESVKIKFQGKEMVPIAAPEGDLLYDLILNFMKHKTKNMLGIDYPLSDWGWITRGVVTFEFGEKGRKQSALTIVILGTGDRIIVDKGQSRHMIVLTKLEYDQMIRLIGQALNRD